MCQTSMDGYDVGWMDVRMHFGIEPQTQTELALMLVGAGQTESNAGQEQAGLPSGSWLRGCDNTVMDTTSSPFASRLGGIHGGPP